MKLDRVRILQLVGSVLIMGMASESSVGEVFEHARWAEVLADYQVDGGVDYSGLSGDRESLDRYLQDLAQARPETLSAGEQIAFWCNAYNAAVVDLVLERLPEMTSVREIPGFFDELTVLVANRQMTLDEIENAARGLGDPRVHFAVVCASASCPDLWPEPFEGKRIDIQLEQATRRFLANADKGMSWDREGERVLLSSIFKWYAGDFTGGGRLGTAVSFFARGRVLDWVLKELPPLLADEIRQADPSVEYLDYDWSLNDRSP